MSGVNICLLLLTELFLFLYLNTLLSESWVIKSQYESIVVVNTFKQMLYHCYQRMVTILIQWFLATVPQSESLLDTTFVMLGEMCNCERQMKYVRWQDSLISSLSHNEDQTSGLWPLSGDQDHRSAPTHSEEIERLWTQNGDIVLKVVLAVAWMVEMRGEIGWWYKYSRQVGDCMKYSHNCPLQAVGLSQHWANETWQCKKFSWN